MIVPLEKPGSPEELVHFGVKGMRWGIKKSEDSSSGGTSSPKKISPRKERKAQSREAGARSKQAEIDRLTSKGKSAIPGVQLTRNLKVRELQGSRDRKLKAAKDIREGHLTDGQKKALVGAAVVGTALAAYGTYKLVDSGGARQLLSRNTQFKQNDLLSRKMSPERIFDEVVKPINPNFGDAGTKMNCRRCTFAYEMRRRGMDVKSTLSVKGSGQTPTSLLNATDPTAGRRGLGIFKRATKLATEDEGGPVHSILASQGLGAKSIGKGMLPHLDAGEKSQWIFDQLGKNPEGARGELGVGWFGGGKHSMVWEIVGGKPVIFDAQSGKAFDNPKFASEVAGFVNQAGYTRLDNIPLNTTFLKRWVRNA